MRCALLLVLAASARASLFDNGEPTFKERVEAELPSLMQKARAASAAAAEATQKVAESAHSEFQENLPELKRQAWLMQEKSAAAAEQLAHATKELAEDSAPVWQQMSRDAAATTAVVTDQAAKLIDEGMSSGMETMLAFLDISKETLKVILTGAANLGFCVIMLLGFVYLPPDLMVVIGGVTFLIGPALVMLFFFLMGELVHSAATAPIFFVAVIFILSLLRSRLFGIIGIKLGLDADGDGRITMKDCIRLLRDGSLYKSLTGCLDRNGFVKLADVEAALDRANQPAGIEGLHERMAKLETDIEEALKKLAAAKK